MIRTPEQAHNTAAAAGFPVFVGRQAIYNSNREVAAYEVLYRRCSGDQEASIVDGTGATARVAVEAFARIGLETLVGEKTAFINATEYFLLSPLVEALPPEQVVIELLEEIEPTAAVIERVLELKRRGYRFALDDFVLRDGLQGLVDAADVIKVELPAIRPAELGRQVAQLRRRNLLLLAEKVETHEEFQRCRQLGFDYFQGYFLHRPEVVRRRGVNPSRLSLVRVLAELNRSEADFKRLASVVAADPALAYQLIRLTNSVAAGARVPIVSLRHALAHLGSRRVASWISMILLARLNHKPSELVFDAILRACFCQSLGRASGRQESEALFLVGLFSLLDALFDSPLEDALEGIPIDPRVSEALLSQSGEFGPVLCAAVAFQRGDTSACAQLGLEPSQAHDLFVESLELARGFTCFERRCGALPRC